MKNVYVYMYMYMITCTIEKVFALLYEQNYEKLSYKC